MYCKLTNQNLQTHNSFQWTIGEWKETSGKGPLCDSGWLHCYSHPLLAVFLNSIHARINNPRLFEIEIGGKIQEDYGLKVGFTKMRLIKEIPLPQVTNTQKITFGILCAKEVATDEKWHKWADNWLNNTDRTAKAYYVDTAAAAYCAAAYCAAAYCAAAYAANAASAAAYAAYAAYAANAANAVDYYAAYCAAAATDAVINSNTIDLIAIAEKAITFN